MKREINLITPEYLETGRISGMRILGNLLAILLIFGFLSMLILFPVWRANLQSEVESLREEEERLQVEVAEIREMEARIEAIKQREQVLEEIAYLQLPFTRNLEAMRDTSGGGISVYNIEVEPDRQVIVRGEAVDLENIALYMQDLEALEFLGEVDHTHMRLEDEELFVFEARTYMERID